ncbi:MAG: isoprenylcysteine carboxylmethyltransferase family protein [Pseudomonadota bacterium]
MPRTLLGFVDLPPVWLVGFMALASLLATQIDAAAIMLWPGRVLIALGVALAVWAALSFRRAKTTIVPRERPDALVTDGPYKISRNPIYLADLLILAGWCISLGFLISLVFVGTFWWVLDTRFVKPEERVLADDLGAPYLAYKEQVRRWI